MITSRKELNEYLNADFKQYHKRRMPFILRWLIKDEETSIKHYIWVLRHTEYNINKHSISRYFWRIWHKRLSNTLHIHLSPNICGPGLRLVHIAGGIYLNAISIGKNFTATTGVVIGKKDSNENRPIICDNVNFTIGAKAYGRITIKDNVVVAPNSVVIKDISAYSIVSGIPAKIIKTNNEHAKNTI